MILNGKIVAQEIYDNLKKEISILQQKPKLTAILVGNNLSSIRYINQKQKWAREVGIDFELLHFQEDISEKYLLNEIKKLNDDEKINGFIVQLPLPKHIDENLVINSINPKKDVDGFHVENQGKIVVGDDSGLTACTPTGVLKLLEYYNIDVIGKNIVIIGRSNIVGKPLANMLINKQATVSVCNSKTKNILFYTKNADIVITAMGVAKFLKKEMINDNTIVIDVGFSVIDDKIYGDSDFENILANGNDITPVPGGVGALTVAMLLSNTLKVYKKNS